MQRRWKVWVHVRETKLPVDPGWTSPSGSRQIAHVSSGCAGNGIRSDSVAEYPRAETNMPAFNESFSLRARLMGYND